MLAAGASYDVVVVGAGVIGLSCAWRAAQAGLSVLVLDREQPGAGASGVAAGMLAPVTEAEFGEEALLRLNLEGAAAWPAFAAELSAVSGEDLGYTPSGALVVAADRDDAEELRRLHAFQLQLGLPSEWLSGRECRDLEPALSPRAPGGIHNGEDHHVDPRAVIQALTRAVRLAGGVLEVGVAVGSVEIQNDAVTGVRTGEGSVAAGTVVMAAGAWSGDIAGLTEDQRPPVRPVKGQILRLRRPTAEPLVTRLVRTPRCYVVDRPGGEVVIGATMEEQGFDTRVTAEGVYRLLEAAHEVLPDVLELELVEARAALRPGSPDNAPLVGLGAVSGLIWATGHHRNGVLLAPVTGEAVAALLTGAEPIATMVPFGLERVTPALTGSAA